MQRVRKPLLYLLHGTLLAPAALSFSRITYSLIRVVQSKQIILVKAYQSGIHRRLCQSPFLS